MANKIYLIGESKSQKLIQEVAANLNTQDYEPIICLFGLSDNDFPDAWESELAIVFIDSNTSLKTLRYIEKRYNQKKYTLNVFVEPINMDEERRELIGRTDSVFLNLSKDILCAEINGLLKKYDEFEYIGTTITKELDSTLTDFESKSSKSSSVVWWIITLFIIIGGIWIYLDKSKTEQEKEKLKILHTAWNEYLSDTYSGQILSTVSETLLRENPEEFNQYGFDNFIDGNINPSKSLSWGDIGPVIHDITITFPTPVDLTPIMSNDLRTVYYEAVNSNYSVDNWNPIDVLNSNGVITILNIDVANSSRYVLNYTPYSYPNKNEEYAMVMALEGGKWKISDFTTTEDSFIKQVKAYLYSANKKESVLYFGTINTPGKPTPISLAIYYSDDTQDVTGIYKNLDTEFTIELTGFSTIEETHLNGTNDNIAIILSLIPEGTDILSGYSYISTNGEESVKFDVILKESDLSPEPLEEISRYITLNDE